MADYSRRTNRDAMPTFTWGEVKSRSLPEVRRELRDWIYQRLEDAHLNRIESSDGQTYAIEVRVMLEPVVVLEDDDVQVG